MSDPRPTASQLRTLRLAQAGDLVRSESAAALYRPYTLSAAPVARKTVDVCVRRGWLQLGERQEMHRPYLLTDAGKAALARWGGGPR